MTEVGVQPVAEARAIQRATIMVNLEARGVDRRFDAAKAQCFLEKRTVEARLVVPDSAEDATRGALAAAERDDDVIFVVGGDGSMRQAALGVAHSKTALASIPAGTVNVFAREVGIPSGIRAACEAHLAGQVVAMDLGRAGDGCFLLMAGIGWDAEVAKKVSPRLKKRIGDVAYVVQGALMAPRVRTRSARWTADEITREGPLAVMVVSNTRLYGGRVRFTPDAVANDGLLDMAALFPRTVADAARLAAKLALNRLKNDGCLFEGRVTEVSVETPGMAVQLDGDYAGETPMRFSVEPGALLVSVPSGPLPPILAAR